MATGDNTTPRLVNAGGLCRWNNDADDTNGPNNTNDANDTNNANNPNNTNDPDNSNDSNDTNSRTGDTTCARCRTYCVSDMSQERYRGHTAGSSRPRWAN